MCGIAGIFAYSDHAPPVVPAEILGMRDAMQARGPDGAGLWVAPEARLALAHRRLSIIDLSEAGAQPMATADGSLRVVFNGEIYNYRELRRELEGQGHRFQSNSDTEVLLHLYRQHGPNLVERLRGMYAFALWDETNRRCLLARDPFGIKPLYYADDGGTLRFASQVKALLAGGGLDPGAEPAGHVGFFLWGWVPEPYTLFQGVRALEAGAILVLEAGGQLQVSRFCNLVEELRQAEAAGEQLNCTACGDAGPPPAGRHGQRQPASDRRCAGGSLSLFGVGFHRDYRPGLPARGAAAGHYPRIWGT